MSDQNQKIPFIVRLSLTLFAIGLIIVFMWFGKTLMVPLFFSFLVSILLHPLALKLERKGLARPLAAIITLLGFMILVIGLFYFFT